MDLCVAWICFLDAICTLSHIFTSILLSPSAVDTLNFSNITDPIGLFIDANSQTIFIGSNGSPSAVYAYNISTGALLQTYQDPTLQHPAGMITLNGALWVISQTVGSVLQFDVASGVLLGTPISSTPDTPEQIFLSPC